MTEKTNQPNLKSRIKNLSFKKIALISAVLLLFTLGSAFFVYDQYRFESTDDAYVQAYSTQISPKVSGLIARVLVQENQAVTAGQILVQIDPKDYDAALRDALATLGSLQAQLASSELDFRRSQTLLQERVVSRQAFDRAQAAYLDLERRTKAASAKVDEARLNVEYTSVRAPANGEIARRSVDVGMYVPAGTSLLGFVPSDKRWVDANFKETQLPSLALGRPAKIHIDAIPGKTYEGFIESISPATGATFTLLPPDNATGNFTKVTQRVPVRIRLKNLSPRDIELLQAGLSATVDVEKHENLEPVPAPPPPIFAAQDLEPSAPGEPPEPAEQSAGSIPGH